MGFELFGFGLGVGFFGYRVLYPPLIIRGNMDENLEAEVQNLGLMQTSMMRLCLARTKLYYMSRPIECLDGN